MALYRKVLLEHLWLNNLMKMVVFDDKGDDNRDTFSKNILFIDVLIFLT